MNVNIDLNKASILSEIQNITARFGKGIGEIDLAVTDDENTSITILYTKNVNKILGEISRFTPSYASDTITIVEPSNFNSAVLPVLKSAMEDLILNLTVSDWLSLNGKDPKPFQDAAVINLNNVKLLINARSK